MIRHLLVSTTALAMMTGVALAQSSNAGNSSTAMPSGKTAAAPHKTHHGAYAEKSRVKGEWLVPLPEGMSPHDAMAIGTAGYTAMLSVLALERHEITPDRGPTLSIPGWTAQPTPTAEQINPGLAPGVQTSPRYDRQD